MMSPKPMSEKWESGAMEGEGVLSTEEIDDAEDDISLR